MTYSTYSWMLTYMFHSCTLWNGIWWFTRRFSFIIFLACPLWSVLIVSVTLTSTASVHRSDWILLMHQFTNLDFVKNSRLHLIPHVIIFCELSCQHGCLARLYVHLRGVGRVQRNQQKIQKKTGYVCIKSIKYQYTFIHTCTRDMYHCTSLFDKYRITEVVLVLCLKFWLNC